MKAFAVGSAMLLLLWLSGSPTYEQAYNGWKWIVAAAAVGGGLLLAAGTCALLGSLVTRHRT